MKRWRTWSGGSCKWAVWRSNWLLFGVAFGLFACRDKGRFDAVPRVDAEATNPSAVSVRAAPAESRPFLLILHGLGGSGEQMARDLELRTFSAEKGFIYATPDGALDSAGRRFWDAGPVCCNFGGERVEDVSRLTTMIRDAIQQRNADPSRIYVVGYSNGGFMAHRLACEHAELVRAIVSIAAAEPSTSRVCKPNRAVAVLEIHGDQDRVVPLDGGHLFGNARYPTVPAVKTGLALWAQANHCAEGMRVTHHWDLLETVSGDETEVLEFSACVRPVEFWRVTGGTHALPLGKQAREKIWMFLERAAE